MPPRIHLTVIGQLCWCAERAQDRLHIRLGIIDIDRTAFAVNVFAKRTTYKDTCDQCFLLFRLATVEGGANLEQGYVVETTRLITSCCLQQAGQ